MFYGENKREILCIKNKHDVMMMMMMMMMMMSCFCGMVDRRKTFSLTSSRDHCRRSSTSRISDKPRAESEHTQHLSLLLEVVQ